MYVPRDKWAMCKFEISRGTYCAELWAQDTNAINCDYVYKKPYKDVDLVKSSYVADAFPIVETQLAKAAWRLAGWLNAVIVYNYESAVVGGDHDQATLGMS